MKIHGNHHGKLSFSICLSFFRTTTTTTQSLPRLQTTPRINPDFFFATSSSDLIESDVRLCLDDILDEVIVRTTVK